MQTSSKWPSINLRFRHLRIGAALAAVGLAAVIGVVRLSDVSTSDAVLDGRRIVVRAQIDGRVAEGAPKVGEIVAKSDVVATVEARTTDRRATAAAEAQRAEIQSKIGALDEERARLEALHEQLQGEVVEFSGAASERMKAEIQTARAQARAAEAAFKLAHAEADRARQMIGTGTMGASEIDHKLGEEDQARQRLAAAKSELARLVGEAEALALGTNPRDGQNNVPYSRQRLDEITIRLAEIDSQRAALAARAASLAVEIAGETDWLHAQSRAESAAPGRSVVWQRPVAPGTDVVKGDVLVELVDCADMFVLARVKPSKAALIAPGDPVAVEIAGRRHDVPGTVRLVRGSASADRRGSEAAGLQAPGAERWAEVEIAVEGRDIAGDGENFCGVGSGARVSFPARSVIASFLPL